MSLADLHPAILVWLAAAAGFYAVGVRRVARARTHPWPARRSASFATGIGVAVIALLVDTSERLSDHMLQHLLLMLVAAPLLVAAAPLSLALQATQDRARARLGAAVRSRPVRVLTHPLVTFAVFALVNAAIHLTGFYELADRSDTVHLGEHALFLASAMLFWLPVLGTNPVRQLRSWLSRTFYLMLAMPPMSAVAVVLLYAEEPRYPSYAASARAHGFSAIADQQDAAAYMWVFGSIVMVVAAVAVGWQALVREERRQQAIDALEASA